MSNTSLPSLALAEQNKRERCKVPVLQSAKAAANHSIQTSHS